MPLYPPAGGGGATAYTPAATTNGTTRIYPFDRKLIQQNATGPGATGTPSGTVYLTYFTAEVAFTVNNITYYCSTPASAGITLAKFGLYSVAANGDITLQASTASDTTLLATTNTAFTKAVTTPFAMSAGARYAGAFICVGGTQQPAVIGNFVNPTTGNAMVTALASEGPRVIGITAAQADLPATLTEAAIATATNAGPTIRDIPFFKLT